VFLADELIQRARTHAIGKWAQPLALWRFR
jgi:hypothetical protein